MSVRRILVFVILAAVVVVVVVERGFSSSVSVGMAEELEESCDSYSLSARYEDVYSYDYPSEANEEEEADESEQADDDLVWEEPEEPWEEPEETWNESDAASAEQQQLVAEAGRLPTVCLRNRVVITTDEDNDDIGSHDDDEPRRICFDQDHEDELEAPAYKRRRGGWKVRLR